MASRDFKKQLSERKASTPRVAIPQVDPEAPKPTPAEPVAPAQPPAAPGRVETVDQPGAAASDESAVPTAQEMVPVRLATVDTNEAPVNRGFHMYPSRHKQLRDLAYVEERKPWQVIEDALEEYVIRHYGKQFKRR